MYCETQLLSLLAQKSPERDCTTFRDVSELRVRASLSLQRDQFAVDNPHVWDCQMESTSKISTDGVLAPLSINSLPHLFLWGPRLSTPLCLSALYAIVQWRQPRSLFKFLVNRPWSHHIKATSSQNCAAERLNLHSSFAKKFTGLWSTQPLNSNLIFSGSYIQLLPTLPPLAFSQSWTRLTPHLPNKCLLRNNNNKPETYTHIHIYVQQPTRHIQQLPKP